MFAAIGSWFAGNKLARDIGIFIAMCLALFLGERAYRWNVESGVKRRMNDKHAREQAETRVDIAERTDSIITQERNNADQALEARDRGGAPATYDELSDSQKAIAEGRARPRQ